jgi:hypothetical protein
MLEIHIDSEDDWGRQIEGAGDRRGWKGRSGSAASRIKVEEVAVAKPDGEAMRPGEIVGTDLRNGRRRGHTSDGKLNPGGGEDGENENADADQDHDRIQT